MPHRIVTIGRVDSNTKKNLYTLYLHNIVCMLITVITTTKCVGKTQSNSFGSWFYFKMKIVFLKQTELPQAYMAIDYQNHSSIKEKKSFYVYTLTFQFSQHRFFIFIYKYLVFQNTMTH